MSKLFQISAKLHYGLFFMTELAKAYETDKLVSLQEITNTTGFVSQGFLEEIVSALRASKLVEGKRGIGGGYRLLKKPKEITIADIVYSIEGPVAFVPCQNSSAPKCPIANQCQSKKLWGFLQGKVDETLSRTSLADI